MRKVELDRKVAHDTGTKASLVSYVTQTFLDELTEALVSGKAVELRGFGTLQVRKQRGTPLPGTELGNAQGQDPGVRFRVCFTKSVKLRRVLQRNFKEKQHGKIRR